MSNAPLPSNAAIPKRVAYVVKRYPRFSETFVVNEILAHEAAGLDIEIFALRPATDAHFQHAIADVRAAVTHLRYGGIKSDAFWQELSLLASERPTCWNQLRAAGSYSAAEVYQSLLLARAVLDHGVDHIHAHFATTAAAVARLASLITGVSYSITAHAKDIFHQEVDEALLADKFANASAVITVSDFNVRELRRRFPQSAGRIFRIYNGLKAANCDFVDAAQRPPLILSAGRLVEKKGFAILIEACALLAKQNVEFDCKIAGSGDLAAQLEQLVGDRGLQGRVELTGAQPRDAILALMKQAAVFAAPCVTAKTGDRDGLPTVLLEAMTCGAPCVATDLVGIPEAVRHQETGLLAAERDPVALAAALRDLLEDRPLRSRLAQGASALVAREFDVDRNAAQLREVFARGGAPAARPILAEVG